ncbi:prefoldin subunit alpha [Candidatus Woesearchaeota archaeon]|nr:prefoldin subunit alpha [Candidatus Woesearchaeota archaeon]
MTNKITEEELQEKYLQFKTLQEHIEQITEQAEMLNQRNVELEATKESLDEIGKTKVNTEMLAPLAEGIFMKTQLKDNTNIIVNVGADITVEKPVSDVRKMLEEQKKELTMKIIEAQALLQGMQKEAMEIYQFIQEHAE